MLTVERPAGTLWPIADHLGTPVVYQDTNHASSIMGSFLYAYGEDQVNKNPADIGSPKRFTGHERDQNLSFAEMKDDLDYMHARHYSPHLGRFLKPDPFLRPSRAIAAPLLWNMYSYAASNPVNAVDPLKLTRFRGHCHPSG
jgi:RHS repeat-associated protein